VYSSLDGREDEADKDSFAFFAPMLVLVADEAAPLLLLLPASDDSLRF
jgi:hypothetical protein